MRTEEILLSVKRKIEESLLFYKYWSFGTHVPKVKMLAVSVTANIVKLLS